MPEPKNIPSGWTLDAYISHNEALRDSEQKFLGERDRRYAEVKNAEEKALRVKEDADKTALGLQRENQQYKDEKANQLREQISSERGVYATKTDVGAAVDKIGAQIGPLLAYVSSQQGGAMGRKDILGWVIAAIMLAITVWPHIK